MLNDSPASAGDTRDVVSVLGLGRSPEVRNENALQYSCLAGYIQSMVLQREIHSLKWQFIVYYISVLLTKLCDLQ